MSERGFLFTSPWLLMAAVLSLSLSLGACSSNDSNCASCQPWSGTMQLGATSADTHASGVTADAGGNVYVAGYTSGGLDGNALTGTSDLFVTKYNIAGTKQWTEQLGVANVKTGADGVVADAAGNVYVAGVTYGGLDGNTLTGTSDFFVTKYDTKGVKQWTRQLGVPGASTAASSITTDAGGNVYVVGVTYGGLDGNTLMGTSDFFVTRYDANGVRQWTRQLGASGANTVANGVATDTSGNVYVTGFTNGNLDGNTLAGTSDFFVTKYDSSGTKQFTKQLGVAGGDTRATGIATDGVGNVYVAGFTTGGLDGNALTGTSDFFVTKYDANGVKQWTGQLGVAGASTSANSVVADYSGHVYVSGTTTGGLDGNVLSGAGDTDSFVTMYDSYGTKHWTAHIGAAGANTVATSITMDVYYNIYVAGYTTGGLDGNKLTGTSDFFVMQYW